MTDAPTRSWGAQSITAPLLEVLVHRPDAAFGAAFDDPAHAEGNPLIQVALEAAGCEVHTYPGAEIGINGAGGPTCMARPILRAS